MDFGEFDICELDIDALMKEVDEEDSRNRFAFLDDEKIFDLGQRRYSENSLRRIRHVLKTFAEWRAERNRMVPTSSTGGVPMNVVEEFTRNEINQWFSAFLAEVRKTDGEPYKARCIFEMAIVLQMHMNLCGKVYKFFCDPEFATLKNTVDSIMKDLQKKGLG